MPRILISSLFVFAVLVGVRGFAEDKKAPAGSAAPTVEPESREAEIDALFKEYDSNKDGYLSREELPEALRPAFDELDKNKDGKLSRDEVREGWTALQPHRRPSDLLFVLIEMSDCDKDCCGEIQRLYDALRKLDKNNDGKIDADELKEARHELVKERVQTLFRELDKNKDGKISKDEARGQIKRDFDEIDTNHDGFIDQDELMKAASAPPRPGKTGDRKKESAAPAPGK
jgi:Ca2+-binding EF-hand superfamily protein